MRVRTRTQRFSLGVPRQLTLAADGRRVLFRRTRGGADRAGCLWLLDERGEHLLADPDLPEPDGRETATGRGARRVPAAEQARRERARERSTGIVAYSADHAAARATFAVGDRLWFVTVEGERTSLPTAGPPVDPQIDPTGSRVAYVVDGALHVVDVATGQQRTLASPESPEVTYGLPEHVAAEEMHRLRGFWWSPDGARLLVARVDNAAVARWWVADAADPAAPPRRIFYPVAGTANADVSLFVVALDGSRTEVVWDRAGFEYLATVAWDRHGPLLSVQSRDQRTLRVLSADPATGETGVLLEQTDPSWVALVPGSPVRTASGRLVVVADDGDARRLVVDGHAVTDDGLQVREVLGTVGETVWFAASTEPTDEQVWTFGPGEGAVQRTTGAGLHLATVADATVAISSFTDGGHAVSVSGPQLGQVRIESLEEPPLLEARVQWLSVGPRALQAALVLPHGHETGARRLPVLLSPYGGPAMQRVTRARHWYLTEAQWFADQGFAVLLVDGAGTPGRGPAWDRAIEGDVLSPVIDDQLAALDGVAERQPDLDLERVAIRGWSFGGLLAMASVLRRPDRVHTAIAGAAPTDMHLYDTHYRERYLGHPDRQPEQYRRCSMVHEASSLRRPLLMIHGVADDNVHVANALRMSDALRRAGRPHEVLLLPSATHMVTDPEDSLLLYELEFLRRSLPSAAPGGV